MIYPVDSAIRRLNNRDQGFNFLREKPMEGVDGTRHLAIYDIRILNWGTLVESELNFLRNIGRTACHFDSYRLTNFIQNPFPNFWKFGVGTVQSKVVRGPRKSMPKGTIATLAILCVVTQHSSSPVFPPIKKREMQGVLRDDLWEGGGEGWYLTNISTSILV